MNDAGYRVGQSHPAAKLTDHDVELLRHLHEVDGWGARRLAKAFEISRSQARRIMLYEGYQTPTRFK